MTSELKPNHGKRDPSRFNLRPLHLFTLCGFAFTEPLLAALARQPVYLHDQQIGWTEIGALLFILTICLPLGLVSADLVALAISKRLRGKGRNIVFLVLFALIVLSLLRPYTAGVWARSWGCAGYLTIIMSLIGAAIAVSLYEKVSWMRSWLTIAAVGLVIFPGAFLRQFWSIRTVEPEVGETVVANHPTHVVMVVLDEFSGTTLLNDKMEIDGRRFPQFARLAKQSTFYRNATTVHPRTSVAVPAILSGRFPVTELPALASSYPGNLFWAIKATPAFDMAVFEPVTRLCPKLEHHRRSRQSALQKSNSLIRTLASVYLRLIIATDLPVDLPAIPREWFSIGIGPEDQEPGWDQFSEGLFYYSGGVNRPQQLAHFLNCIKSSNRPRFTFLHAELPHAPWVFFPDGEQYFYDSNYFNIPAGAAGDLGEDWLNDPATVYRSEFRYRLQVGFVDRFVGRLLDRLIETNVWDRCLLIVTADHGVSFRPGHSRRLLDGGNLADIASVPLFIKLPGQKEGRMDDRNVESVDIFPTIAETLGIELPEPVDGISVSQERRRLRKTLYYDKSMTVIEPNFPQRRAAVLRQFEMFGHDDLDQLPAGIATHPEWHGRGISSFVVEGPPAHATLIDPLRDRPLNSTDGPATAVETPQRFIKGQFDDSDLPEKPAQLVVSVDGIVRDSGTTFRLYRNRHGFEFLLPKSALQDASSVVRLYLVDRSRNPPSLRPVESPLLR